MAAKEIVLAEHLGHHWRNELVSFPLTFEQGSFPHDQFCLVDEHGRPVPCQLTDVRCEQGSVRSAIVWFITDLPALTTKKFLFTFGDGVEQKPEVPWLCDETRLRGKEIVVDNGLIQIRLLGNGGSAEKASGYSPGEISADLAFIRAVKGPDNLWRGEGRVCFQDELKSYKVRMLQTGPVFADVEIVYILASGESHRQRIRVCRHADGFSIHEESSRYEPPLGEFRFSLYKDLIPETALSNSYGWLVVFNGVGTDKLLYDQEKDLTDRSVRGIKGFPGENWQAVYRDDDVSKDTLGVFGTDPTFWHKRSRLPSPADVRTIRVIQSPEPDLYILSEMKGKAAWYLLVTDKTKRADFPRYRRIVEQWPQLCFPELCRGQNLNQAEVEAFNRKYGIIEKNKFHYYVWHLKTKFESPLNRAKDYHLAFETRDRARRPFVFFAGDNVEDLREYYLRGAGKSWFEQIDDAICAAENASSRVKSHVREQSVYLLCFKYYLTGEAKYGRMAKESLLEHLKDRREHLFRWSSLPTINGLHMVGAFLANDCQCFDVLDAGNIFTAEERSLAEALLSYCAYKIMDRDYYPWDGLFEGAEIMGNFVTNGYMGLTYFATTFPDHPDREKFLNFAMQLLQLQMAGEFYDSGVYIENPFCYYMGVMDKIVSLLLPLKASGYDITPYLETLKKSYCCLFHMLTPPDQRYDKIRILPLFGDGDTEPARLGTTHLRGLDFALARKLFVGVDDGFAELFEKIIPITISNRAAEHAPEYSGTYLKLPFRELAQAKGAMPAEFLNSVHLEGFGVVLRGHGDEKGDYLAMRCADTYAHYNYDENSFILYAYGQPIALDGNARAGYGRDPRKTAVTTFMHNTVVFDRRNQVMPEGKGRNPADPRILNFKDNEAFSYAVGDASRVAEVEKFHRHIYYLKGGRYYLIHDEIECREEEKPEFMFHVLAEDISIDGTTLHCDGSYGVDCDLIFVQPTALQVEVGHAGYDQGVNPHKYLAAGHQEEGTLQKGFITIIYPYERGKRNAFSVQTKDEQIEIQWPDRKDVIDLEAAAASTV